MKTNTLQFNDYFTGKPVFTIRAPVTPPKEGVGEAMIDKHFNWLASVGAPARAMQYRLGLSPVTVTEVVTPYSIQFTDVADFLKAIKHVNSKQYDESLLRKIRWYNETGNLVQLRRTLTSLEAVVVTRPT